MAFAPTKPSKSPYITHLATFPSQISPTNFGDEACWFCAFSACMAQDKKVGAFLKQLERFDISRFKNTWTVSKLASEADLVVIFGRDQEWHEDSNAPLPAELHHQREWISVFSCRLNPIVIIKSRRHENGDSGIQLELAGL